MITEFATLTIAPDQAQAFEQAVSEARVHLLSDPACLSFQLNRVVEIPGVYLLIVGSCADGQLSPDRGLPTLAGFGGPLFR